MSNRHENQAAAPAYADLPVRLITTGHGDARLAVHLAGRLSRGRVPLICIPAYHRNMSDFSDFVKLFPGCMDPGWPVLLVDLHGRGRSSDRPGTAEYTTPADARDLSQLADALAIEQAVFVGQGYGGQVVMTLAALRPTLIAAAVLIDSGPVTDSRGLVRLRNNLEHIASLRGEAVVQGAYRRVLAADYPGASEDRLDRLAQRTHFIDKRGLLQPLFDPFLLKRLQEFDHDDVLVAQWPLFDALKAAPLMLLRTQLTDQLRRQTFDEMVRRRPDAVAMVLADQGSPALLDHDDEVDAIAGFVRDRALQRGPTLSAP